LPYRAFIDRSRKFGVEIECFGIEREELHLYFCQWGVLSSVRDLYSANDYECWTLGVDNTIIGENPVEIISPELLGLDGLSEVKRVCQILESVNLKVNDSCAFHVHWDVSDFTGWHVVQLLRLYAKFEPVIDLFMDPSRRGNKNSHCQSLIKEGGFEWMNKLRPFLHEKAYQVADTFSRTQGLSTPVTSLPSSRHHKVNPVSILKYGTVEFRQHQGTLNFNEMMYWILFTGQLINRVKSGIVVNSGKASLGSLISLLKLSDNCIDWRGERGDMKILAEMREHYKRVSRRNRSDV
jgi:putative amidoligase enzyme